ncbi:MAG: hypothetical protein AAFN92_11075, partial [Bacteroidota bacterium]
MKTLSYSPILIFFLLVTSFQLVAQAEVYTNLLEGTPLPFQQPVSVQDDKLDYAGRTPEMDELDYVHNRIFLNFYRADGQSEIPVGTYEVLIEVRKWLNGTSPTAPADESFMRRMVVTVTADAAAPPRAQYTITGARKMEVEVLSIQFNDGPLPADPPRMQLVTEIALERDYCALDLDVVPAPYFFDAMDEGDHAVARVERVVCADEYDFEYVFYDEDSRIGKLIYENAQGDPTVTVNTLFKNNATRLTSPDLNFRLFHLYRKGFVVARYRAVQYTSEGVRTYTPWSDANRNLWEGGTRYPGIVVVEHQVNYNWQASTNFAEEAKQLPAVNYLDGTMRNRQSRVLQYEEVNGAPRPEEEYVIAQQTLYDAMGRPAVQVLPAPLYGDGTTIHPLEFDPASLVQAARGAGESVYDKEEIEAETSCGLLPEMTITVGAGKFYSPNNDRIDRGNAYVPDGEGYPFSVTRYTPDNTGRIQRQGGVGPVLQLGGKDTRYYYGKPNQWELDRLFGANVGDASHYEKRMTINPDGQASVAYLDTKGRTVATALTGPVPNQYTPLDSHLDPAGVSPVEVNLLNNVEYDDRVESSYSLLVTAPDRYDICYALEQATYATNCCADNICPDC